MKIDRDMMVRLDRKFQDDVVNAVLEISHHFGSVKEEDNYIYNRVKFITSEFFGSMFFSERDYMLAIYGAIAPNAAFEDFCYYTANKFPCISDYFTARNYGSRNFVGKWVVTKKNHSASKTIPAGSIVKIIGESCRGYDIMAENGDKVLEIGFEI